MAWTERLRRRRRLGFIPRIVVVVGAPIIAVVVLGFEVRPLLRLLAVHVDLVLVGITRGRRAWGPARKEYVELHGPYWQNSQQEIWHLHGPACWEDIPVRAVHGGKCMLDNRETKFTPAGWRCERDTLGILGSQIAASVVDGGEGGRGERPWMMLDRRLDRHVGGKTRRAQDGLPAGRDVWFHKKRRIGTRIPYKPDVVRLVKGEEERRQLNLHRITDTRFSWTCSL
jgi:hypothetical protein